MGVHFSKKKKVKLPSNPPPPQPIITDVIDEKMLQLKKQRNKFDQRLEEVVIYHFYFF
jgi:hypothetical protein